MSHGAMLNITCQIQRCSPTPPGSVKEFQYYGGQCAAAANTAQALQSFSALAEPPPGLEPKNTSDNTFMMCPGSQPMTIPCGGIPSAFNFQPTPAAEHCPFYIPHWMIEQQASLWPNDMMSFEPTSGLPSSPLMNYYIMAIG